MATRRPYRSTRRAEQARATRRAILDTAERLFYDRGYASTSIREIAEKAAVSEETIYSVFGDKRSILEAIGARLLDGDDEVAIRDSPLGRAVAEAETRADRIRIAVRAAIESAQRGDLREVVDKAVASDPRLAQLADWADRQSHQVNFEVFDLVVGDTLDPEVKEQASDLVWSILSTQTIRRLIHRRGWSVDAAEAWLTGLIEWTIREAASRVSDAD